MVFLVTRKSKRSLQLFWLVTVCAAVCFTLLTISLMHTSVNLEQEQPEPLIVSWTKNSYVFHHRVVHLDLKGAPLLPTSFQPFFQYFAKIGATGVLIEWEDMFPYEKQLSAARNGEAYSKQEVMQILKDAAAFNLDVIPLVPTISHLEWILKLPEFADLRENEKYPQAICVSNQKAVSLVMEMIDQVLALHENAEFVHIGCDEVYQYGRCHRCKLSGDQLLPEELVVQHIAKMAGYIKKRYHKKVIIWHDFILNVPSDVQQKYNLKELVEPMIWNYAESITENPIYWSSYNGTFDYLWGASAFKGANGPSRFHVDLQHYKLNHVSWSRETKRMKKYSFQFRGIALTGWQRYDHTSGLCELLAVAMPSLTIGMSVILYGENSRQIEIQENIFYKCKMDIANCDFPGKFIYSSMVRLHDALSIIHQTVFSTEDMAAAFNVYNLNHNVSSPLRVERLYPNIVDGILTLQRISNNLTAHMSFMYSQNTVDEFLATYVDPTLVLLQQLYNRSLELENEPYSPVRPFPIRRAKHIHISNHEFQT